MNEEQEAVEFNNAIINNPIARTVAIATLASAYVAITAPHVETFEQLLAAEEIVPPCDEEEAEIQRQAALRILRHVITLRRNGQFEKV